MPRGSWTGSYPRTAPYAPGPADLSQSGARPPSAEGTANVAAADYGAPPLAEAPEIPDQACGVVGGRRDGDGVGARSSQIRFAMSSRR